ncbi:MAG: right-handed parallel beta-helix repeat-containing protein [Sphaerochaetaceae bacterium]|nr:right-handed parallel beta-helix repeat-containing protein [Spirochaetales bacterium]MDY5500442.1 right-handed parallel beta-helix repeat-containing protein [Sphaerochaetaceae bacterium]
MKKTLALLLLLVSSSLLFASWAGTKAPVITSIAPSASDPFQVEVRFDFETSGEAGDKASVECYDARGNLVDAKSVGRSRKLEKKASFTLSSSGDYSFVVRGKKRNEEDKLSSRQSYHYTYPLVPPEVTVKNTGGYSFLVSWKPVREAEAYLVSVGEGEYQTNGLSYSFKALQPGKTYQVAVSALRDGTRATSSQRKTAREDADRDWRFTWFGQSTKGTLNRMEMVDADNLQFRLFSCSETPNGDIDEKGGKFTAFHDGISYYYTVIDPKRENFTLTATFTIDFLNPTPDGQEGFGIVAMDSLGTDGVAMENHYTNSAAILATKFEDTIDGVKYTCKDTLGSRFVTGLTNEIVQGGDAEISKRGKSVSKAYSYYYYDLVGKGQSYTITLKMDNTGFHAIYPNTSANKEQVEEYVLYGKDKLLQQDPEHIYVGFAVARGCNVTVSDVRFETSNPQSDPPAEQAPPEYVPYSLKVDSPSSWYDGDYPFVYAANSDGMLTVSDGRRNPRYYIHDVPVKAGVDFTAVIPIHKGVNDMVVTFTPDGDYVPYPGARMGVLNPVTRKYEEDYQPVSRNLTVYYVPRPGYTLYVSPTGDPLAKGSRRNPLDLDSALRSCAPGQTIVLLPGTYHPTGSVKIERGNSGLEGKRKRLVGEGKVVLDFSSGTGSFELWGDYWTLEHFSVTGTKGDKKGLQVAGDYNELRFITAYGCGDTGIQISGTSTEPFAKWPHDNLVYGCVSHDNIDPAANNADGFAAKLTCGENNVFDSCVAYANIDDGWDLFAKIETGPIGAVTIRHCLAYGNGSLSDGSGNGDGNGFKLGGDGIAVPHLLESSVAFQNGAAGITSNSNPAVRLSKVVCWANAGRNIALYGKGNGPRQFQAKEVVSIDGADSDNWNEMPHLAGETTFFWTGAAAVNSLGEQLSKDIFLSTDFQGFQISGAGIDLGSFLKVESDLGFSVGL